MEVSQKPLELLRLDKDQVCRVRQSVHCSGANGAKTQEPKES